MNRIALIVVLLTSSSLTFISPRPVHASSSVNVINNPSFEEGLNSQGYPVGWDFQTCEGVANATVRLDSSLWVNGTESAKVFTGPITNTYCFPNNGTRTLGFTQFRQFLPNGLTFSNLTDSPSGFSFWFYLQPYGSATMGGFEVRLFGAESTDELDYIINPNPSLGYLNYTNPNNCGCPGLRSLLFNGYQTGQWYHFSRNLHSDWSVLGLNLTSTFSLVQFEGIAYQNGSTLESETFWLDEVEAYIGTGSPPPMSHWTIFNFTDANGIIVDKIIRWRLLNSSGLELPYTLGEHTLPDGPYSVEAYFRSYGQQNLIFKEQIHLDTILKLTLTIYPDSSVAGRYIALNHRVASATLSEPDNTKFQVFIQGTAGSAYRMLLDVPSHPQLVQANGVDLTEGPGWSYDSGTSVTIISFVMHSSTENFTVYLVNPPRMPAVSFRDFAGGSLDAKLSFRIVDSRGYQIRYSPGEVLPAGIFYVEAYYKGYQINRTQLTSGAVESVLLQMLPLSSSNDTYLVLNSTAAQVSLSLVSSAEIDFKIDGSGPLLIVLSVPGRPLFIEKDGVHIASWVYNSTSQTIAIESDTSGSFQVVLESPSSFSQFYVGVAIAAIAITSLLGLIVWKRRRHLMPSNETQRRTGGAYRRTALKGNSSMIGGPRVC